MDTGGEGEGGRGRSYTGGTAYFESYAATFIRQAPSDERNTDQLPVEVAGALVDTDDSDLPRVGARSDWEFGGGSVAG